MFQKRRLKSVSAKIMENKMLTIAAEGRDEQPPETEN